VNLKAGPGARRPPTQAAEAITAVLPPPARASRGPCASLPWTGMRGIVWRPPGARSLGAMVWGGGTRTPRRPRVKDGLEEAKLAASEPRRDGLAQWGGGTPRRRRNRQLAQLPGGPGPIVLMDRVSSVLIQVDVGPGVQRPPPRAYSGKGRRGQGKCFEGNLKGAAAYKSKTSNKCLLHTVATVGPT
jgi:hypothetical protein